jgi:hypothetical protein
MRFTLMPEPGSNLQAMKTLPVPRRQVASIVVTKRSHLPYHRGLLSHSQSRTHAIHLGSGDHEQIIVVRRTRLFVLIKVQRRGVWVSCYHTIILFLPYLPFQVVLSPARNARSPPLCPSIQPAWPKYLACLILGTGVGDGNEGKDLCLTNDAGFTASLLPRLRGFGDEASLWICLAGLLLLLL